MVDAYNSYPLSHDVCVCVCVLLFVCCVVDRWEWAGLALSFSCLFLSFFSFLYLFFFMYTTHTEHRPHYLFSLFIFWTFADEREEVVEDVGGRRRRRSVSQERFVEILVVADGKMVSYHGDNLVHYILTLMSVVSTIHLFKKNTLKGVLCQQQKTTTTTTTTRVRD
jgi:K+-sensing histidine kinase KdpD